MVWILFAIAALIGGWGIYVWLTRSTPKQILSGLRWTGLLLALAGGTWLVLTGRLGLIWTVLPLLSPWLNPRALIGRALLSALVGIFLNRRRTRADSENADQRTGKQRARTQEKMSRAEALLILGLKDGASLEEIRAAYHEKMRRMHPDTGGTTEAAQLINQAYDLLTGTA